MKVLSCQHFHQKGVNANNTWNNFAGDTFTKSEELPQGTNIQRNITNTDINSSLHLSECTFLLTSEVK